MSCIGNFRDFETLNAVIDKTFSYKRIRFCPALEQEYLKFIQQIGKNPLQNPARYTCFSNFFQINAPINAQYFALSCKENFGTEVVSGQHKTRVDLM